MSTLKNPVTFKSATKQIQVIKQVDLTVTEEVAEDILESLDENWWVSDEPGDNGATEEFILKLRKALKKD